MSFLAPLFLLGTLAVALPILFHLTRRSTRRKQSFSSLQFLRPTPPRLTRRNRLEHILLLILRGAVVALLAFAFARPFLLTPAAILPESTAPKRWVLLVDTSASMQRDELWPDALTRVRQRLGDFAPADELALLTFDRAPRALVRFDQWRQWNPADRAALALDLLENTSPGWATAYLDLALVHAVELLEEADVRSDHAATRQIILVSDLSEGARLDAIQGYNWPDSLHVAVDAITPTQPGNAGLHWIVDPDPHQPAAAATEATPRIRITNSEDAQNERFEVAWSNSSNAAPLQIHVPPGQTRVLHAPAPPEIDTERLLLHGDPQPFDNTIHIVTPAPEEIQLLFVGADPADDPRQLLFYLQRAFLSTARQSVRLHTLAPGETAPIDLDMRLTRLAIVAGAIPDSIAPSLHRYAESGGTLLAVLRPENAVQLLASLFPDHSVPVEEASIRDFALLTQIDFAHPIFAPFADPRFSDFTRIHFWNHRRLNPDTLPNARVVARFDAGDPALLEIERGTGRILILTAGWHPADGELALSTKFVPLLHALLDHAGGPRPPLPQYHAGDEILLPGSGDPAFQVQLPDGTTRELDPGVNRFTDTASPGIYAVQAGSQSWSFAVNIDPAESRTNPIPVDDLERLGVPVAVSSSDPVTLAARERQLHQAELESRQSLWRWLILAALLILLLESWLAGRLTRTPAPA
jgi:hypothetical protein